MKILVRAPNWVGDVVMCLPAFEAIRYRQPDAEISILARPSVIDIFDGQRLADKLIVYEHRNQHAGFWGRERLVRELKREHFDVAILFQNAFDAAWLAWRAGIPGRIGYRRDARGFLLTNSIRTPKPGETPAHESYYYLELLRRAGWLDALPPLHRISLRVDDAARSSAENKLSAAGAKSGALRLAIAAGAAYGSAKCWLPERYAAVADRFIDEFGGDVILFGASAETEVGRAYRRGHEAPSIQFRGTNFYRRVPALLSTCHLFIGNDSGAMHVAGAVGVRVVGIFGSSDPLGTAPLTPEFRLVRHEVECSPCFLRTCPIDHRCMTRIAVNDVWAAAESWARELAGGEIA